MLLAKYLFGSTLIHEIQSRKEIDIQIKNEPVKEIDWIKLYSPADDYWVQIYYKSGRKVVFTNKIILQFSS